MRVCAAPAYLEAAGIPTSLGDLASHHAILYGRFGQERSWLFPQPAGPAREIIPSSRLRFDDVGAVRDAALEGHGLAWLPCWLIRHDVTAGRLVVVLGDEPAHAFEVMRSGPRHRIPLAGKPRQRCAGRRPAVPYRPFARLIDSTRDRSWTTCAEVLASAARRLKIGWGTS